MITVLLIKLAATGWYLKGTIASHPGGLLHESIAIAQEQTPDNPPADNPPAGKTEAKADEPSDIQFILDDIEHRRQHLIKEEERLKRQKEYLESLKLQLDQKVDELATLQQKLDTTLATIEEKEKQQQQRRDEAEAAKINQLVKVYTSMKPKTAAVLIDKMDMNIVLKMFSRMKGEQIGQILSYVKPERAADISESLAERNP